MIQHGKYLIICLILNCLFFSALCISLRPTQLHSDQNYRISDMIQNKMCLEPAPEQSLMCSSGWAFATTMALRYRYCTKYAWDFDWDLSAQQIISCAKEDGCDGGTLEESFKYLNNTGLSTGLCYPYKGNPDDDCLVFEDKCPSGIDTDLNKIFKVKNIRKINQSDILTETNTKGAVATCFDLYEDFIDFFKNYPNGVYPPPEYSKKKEGILCAMLIQGTTVLDKDFNKTRDVWILESSWGNQFADNGFFAIERFPKTRELRLEENAWIADPE